MRAVTSGPAKWLSLLAALAMWAATWPAGTRAGVQPSNACAIDGATFMSFGNYDTMTGRSLDQQGRVSYRCYQQHPEQGTKAKQRDDGGDGNGKGGGKIIVRISINAGNAGGFNRYMN